MKRFLHRNTKYFVRLFDCRRQASFVTSPLPERRHTNRTKQKTPTAENQWCQPRINMSSVYSDCNCRKRFESEHKGVQCGSKGKFCGSHHSLAISSLNLRHEIIKSYRGILLEELRKTSVSTADLRAGIWIQKFLNIWMPTIRTLQFSQFRM